MTNDRVLRSEKVCDKVDKEDETIKEVVENILVNPDFIKSITGIVIGVVKEEFERKTKVLEDKAEALEQQLFDKNDKLEQYSRNYNILIFGIEKTEGTGLGAVFTEIDLTETSMCQLSTLSSINSTLQTIGFTYLLKFVYNISALSLIVLNNSMETLVLLTQ
ncbi:hypothetical protein FQA39_LY17678 [Lamprigera yunnana]|nr:hypothetical protein FQA39_LY17678 [Lamprigera yunnana]